MQESTVIISGGPVLADNWENIEMRGYHRESSEDNDAGKLEKKVYVMLTVHIVQDELESSGLWFRSSGLNFVCYMIRDELFH